jgi:hypothetical protein
VTHEELKTKLAARTREELSIVAKKLAIKKHRRGTKQELLNRILTEATPSEVAKAMSVSRWDRVHHHLFGWSSVLGLILAILALVFGYVSQRQKNASSRPSQTPSSSSLGISHQPSAIDFTLYPGAVRGDGERSTVIISSPSVDIIRLHLLLLADKYQSYHGELLTEDRRTLVINDLQASIHDSGKAVIMNLTAQGLPSGDYAIKLSGRTADGLTKQIATYYFRIRNSLDR